MVLLPTDILRALPIAYDWESICDAGFEKMLNSRNRVNILVAEIWKAKTRKDKQEFRKKVLSNQKTFNVLLDAIHNTKGDAYDIKDDPDGLLVWQRIQASIAAQHPLMLVLSKKPSIDDVFRVVRKIVDQFEFLVEKRGLWKEVWHNGKRRNEKSVQRIFYAIADSYCKANDIDISPEADTGTGEIDFKFSTGYKSKVLVEVKLSDNPKLLAGYEKQLEIYKNSEQTNKGIYVVVDIGYLAKKEKKLNELRNERLSENLTVSEIVIIDGKQQKSASKA